MNNYIDKYTYIPDVPLLEVSRYEEIIPINEHKEIISVIEDLFDVTKIIKNILYLTKDGVRETIEVYRIDYFYYSFKNKQQADSFFIPINYINTKIRLKKLERIIND